MQHAVQVITDTDDAFETKVIELAAGLLQCCFGVGIPAGYLQKSQIFQALWISDEDVTVAFALVSEDQGTYKLQGVCVDPNYREQGCATALVKKCESLLPAGSALRLCVDNCTDNTHRLCDWYTRLGFECKNPEMIRGEDDLFDERGECDEDDLFDERGECSEIGFRKTVQ
jgi:ribosomal protein S18 acetylase RimI-like enzyme